MGAGPLHAGLRAAGGPNAMDRSFPGMAAVVKRPIETGLRTRLRLWFVKFHLRQPDKTKRRPPRSERQPFFSILLAEVVAQSPELLEPESIEFDLVGIGSPWARRILQVAGHERAELGPGRGVFPEQVVGLHRVRGVIVELGAVRAPDREDQPQISLGHRHQGLGVGLRRAPALVELREDGASQPVRRWGRWRAAKCKASTRSHGVLWPDGSVSRSS